MTTKELFGITFVKTSELTAAQAATEKREKVMAAGIIIGTIGTVAGTIATIEQTKRLQKVTDERDSAVLELGGKQPSYKDGKEAVAKAKAAAKNAIEIANSLAQEGAAEGASDEAKKKWNEAKEQANRCMSIYGRRCRKFKAKVEELPKLSDGKTDPKPADGKTTEGEAA